MTVKILLRQIKLGKGSVVKLRAAMDDVTAVGSVDSVLGAYDRLATALCSAWDAATTASRPSSRFRWRPLDLIIC